MSAPAVLIVGAGPVGTVAARVLAEKGVHCLVIDQRDHLAGNCFDCKDRNGILIHKYGPHYFRTNNEKLLHFLSRFTSWLPGNYIVKSQIDDKLYPFPINLDTLETFFQKKFDEDSAKAFLENLQVKYSQPPQNSEEFVLSRVGEAMYRAFYLGYTLKQWEKHPRELAASVCGRIPVRFNRDNRYVDHKFQVIPSAGYTSMFTNMITHPNITVETKTDFFETAYRQHEFRAVLYTGPVDRYFGNKYGELPWRSLNFDFRNYKEEFRQPCVQINYPSLDVPYTRTVEIKHVTLQSAPTTTISYETPTAKGDPFYPIPSDESQRLYQKYKALAEKETATRHVYFCGRLAEYTYINTDEAIEKGLGIADRIYRERLAQES